MRPTTQDHAWLEKAVKDAGHNEAIYISENHYDGGYELKVGSREVFVDYEAIDAQDKTWLERLQ